MNYILMVYFIELITVESLSTTLEEVSNIMELFSTFFLQRIRKLKNTIYWAELNKEYQHALAL